MAASCLFLLLVLYTEKAASAVTRKPSDPVRLLIISSLCTLRGNVHFFPMYSSWECSFLPYVLFLGMFISFLCTLRGNVPFLPSPPCSTLRWGVHFFPMYSTWENCFSVHSGSGCTFTILLCHRFVFLPFGQCSGSINISYGSVSANP
jgi:hypothetical protein